LLLRLERGQFARVRLEKRRGLADYLEAAVLPPGDSVPFLRVDVEIPQRVLAWEGRDPGTYTVVLSAPGRARDVKVSVLGIEDPDSLAARRRAVATDPRVAWLADCAIAIRTLDPADTDFADLQPLKPLLNGIRVVLLGEADHGDGSDFLAKSRLIRFLHAEMGFDVLAFESGVYDMWRAWREMSAGRDPRASFLQGAYWMWGLTEQLGPLVAYVAEAARSPRPLVLAGFDVQGSGTISGGARLSDTMIVEMRTFLEANRIAGPFADPRSAENRLLKRLHDFAYRPAPDTIALAALERAIAATAERIELEVNTPEGRYWARILRNNALLAAWRWPQWPNARRRYCATEACRNSGDRDPVMAENLSWLANQQYPGRKIIVWAHNAHIMRNSSLAEAASRSSYRMGDGVWSEFGDESYVIALVSYEGSYRWPRPQGATFTIVPDQSREAEFEELMTATGLRIGLIDLRAPVAAGAWLARPFLARPINHEAERSRWGRNVDAFLFIKTQEPSAAIPQP
jgi:erythromycin esterase